MNKDSNTKLVREEDLKEEQEDDRGDEDAEEEEEETKKKSKKAKKDKKDKAKKAKLKDKAKGRLWVGLLGWDPQGQDLFSAV